MNNRLGLHTVVTIITTKIDCGYHAVVKIHPDTLCLVTMVTMQTHSMQSQATILAWSCQEDFRLTIMMLIRDCFFFIFLTFLHYARGQLNETQTTTGTTQTAQISQFDLGNKEVISII